MLCLKCKQEPLIHVKQLNTTVIREPDEEPITRKTKIAVTGS
ncbi:cysteine-rich KTR domain-containing protein [Lacrimispora sp.]